MCRVAGVGFSWPARNREVLTSDMARADDFLALSSELTGFSPVRLRGTGLLERYLAEVDDILPSGLVDDLLDAHRSAGAGDPGALLADPTWGPVLRSITMLWYCGAWTALPAAWRTAHVAGAGDVDHVVSAEAFQGGLQWVVAGAHPPGARQQGYAAWTVAPEVSGR